MPVLLVGGGLVGSQVANILIGEGEEVTVLDYAPQRESLAENVDVDRLRLVQGDVLNPFSIVSALRESKADCVVHTAAYPMLTIGAQQNPYGQSKSTSWAPSTFSKPLGRWALKEWLW